MAWKHRLSDIDETLRAAVCSNCGPVKIKKSGLRSGGQSGFRCLTAVQEYRRNYGTVNRYHEPNPGVCQICSNTVRVSYDHCHTTKKFRGWLCINCNTCLGLAHDSPERLQKLAEYLKQHQ